MNRWKVVCQINNVHSEPIVSATGSAEAEKLVRSMYAGQTVRIMYIVKVLYAPKRTHLSCYC